MYKLFHNNRCSKSRECKKILEEKRIVFEIVDYLKGGVSQKDLEQIVNNLETDYREIVRTNEKEFKENPFDIDKKSGIISFLSKFPKCLQRPIFFNGKDFTICRPPEKVIISLKNGGGSRI